jgi:hypothetical protein
MVSNSLHHFSLALSIVYRLLLGATVVAIRVSKSLPSSNTEGGYIGTNSRFVFTIRVGLFTMKAA